MSPGMLAGMAVLFGFAAAWELAGRHGEEIGAALRSAMAALSGGRARSLAEAALWLGLPERLRRAGLGEQVSPSAVVIAKVLGAGLGILVAAMALPAVPGRLGIVAGPVLAASGFLAPDALLERAARLRTARLVAALPDALDLLATGAASGRPSVTVLGEIATATSGPLAAELAATVAECETGVPQAEAIDALRERVHAAEVGALTAALERSRTYGSPLARQLHEQAGALRRDARRRIEERAARAAPKIQLVVALVLVPSVLLMILAAIIAHSDQLFGLAAG
jgi:tight adherence protein C